MEGSRAPGPGWGHSVPLCGDHCLLTQWSLRGQHCPQSSPGHQQSPAKTQTDPDRDGGDHSPGGPSPPQAAAPRRRPTADWGFRQTLWPQRSLQEALETDRTGSFQGRALPSGMQQGQHTAGHCGDGQETGRGPSGAKAASPGEPRAEQQQGGDGMAQRWLHRRALTLPGAFGGPPLHDRGGTPAHTPPQGWQLPLNLEDLGIHYRFPPRPAWQWPGLEEGLVETSQ